jgi:hypothetical protein
MHSVKGDTPIDTADLFARGHDLVHHSGLKPWHVSLLSTMFFKCRVLHNFMKAHGHIADAAEMQVQSLKTAFPSRVCGSTEQIVEQITDPFILDLSKTVESFVFLHKEGIIPYLFITRQVITKRRKGVRTSLAYYTGATLLSLVLHPCLHD